MHETCVSIYVYVNCFSPQFSILQIMELKLFFTHAAILFYKVGILIF